MEGGNIPRFVNPAHKLKFPYKIFVKGQEINSDNFDSTKKYISSTSNKTLSGEDTKTFYECLFNEDITESNSIKCVEQSSSLKAQEPSDTLKNQSRLAIFL